MTQIQETLRNIGLTNSEIKVYLALLKIGSATKKAIVKESQITSSKLYEITDKLINKGLVSYVKENKVMHFSASPPKQVIDYIERKKKKLQQQEEDFIKQIPELESIRNPKEPNIQVFRGWEGMRTAYYSVLNNLKPGETSYVIGASPGENKEAVERFFKKFNKARRGKKVIQKFIVELSEREWALKILNNKKLERVRFSEFNSPSEIAIFKNKILIAILTETPVVTLIESEITANSFRNYFEKLWKTSRK